MSVQWADVSEFQCVVNDAYPWPVLAFRSNDGTYRDRKFAANLAWAKGAVARGKLAFFIVYAVYEPDGGNWASTLMSMVGTPHPAMVVMMDVESWGGRISGDHSADINAGRARLAQWLGNSARVIGYGNVGDLNRLWPNKNGAQVVIAAYGSNPSYPGKIAHQYTDRGACAPFGTADMNSADGVDIPTLMGQVGLTADPNNVGPVTPFNPQEDDMGTLDNTEANYQTLAYMLDRFFHFDGRDGGKGVPPVGSNYSSYGATLWENLHGIRAAEAPVTPDQVTAIANAIAAQLKIPAPTVDAAAIAKAVNDDAAARMTS